MQIEARGPISDATTRPPGQEISYFTALCPLRSGTILAAFQLGDRKHSPDSTLGLCRSADGGETWQPIPTQFETRIDGIPGSLGGGEIVEVAPGRLLLAATWFERRDRDRPLFDPVTEGILPSRQLLAESSDEGDTWTPWRELSTPGLTGCALTGPFLQWADGTIAFPFESFKAFDDPGPSRHAAWLMTSHDGGATFDPPQLVARDPDHALYFWDQRLCVGREPGEFVALFWTHDRNGGRDLRVHQLHSSLSAPNPRPMPTETTIPGQIAAPLLLEDGRLLAFVVDRDVPGTMTLWQSPDGGTTWPEASRLVVHRHDERAALSQGREGIDFAGYWEDMGKWTFGHPGIQPLPDGRVLLAWYAGTPDRLSLHWARVDTRR